MKCTVSWPTDRFLSTNEEFRRGALSSVHRMKVFLSYINDPGYQKCIGAKLGVSQATVSRAVNAVDDSIITYSNEWIKIPTTNSEITEEKKLWQRKYKFPTAIGVIGCSHIGILKPKFYGDEFMLTLFDLDPVHDSRIWKNSQVCLQLRYLNVSRRCCAHW